MSVTKLPTAVASPHLLVSVRSAAEAEAALVGGADLIDVKEPNNGPLGAASLVTLQEVLAQVAGRKPVSAALGELSETSLAHLGEMPNGLAYCKWGPAGWRSRLVEYERLLLSLAQACRQSRPNTQPVAVAYADAEQAQAPEPEAICDLACQLRFGVLLLDTAGKSGRCLLDELSLARLFSLREQCSRASLRLALAGSLRLKHLSQLWPITPDWFAVRGAVCTGLDRQATVESAKVADWSRRLACPMRGTADSQLLA